MEHDEKYEHAENKGLMCHFLSWKGVVFVLILGGLSYYLLTERLAHLALALPYIFLLACPLMHIFGHGHGGHGGHHDKSTNKGEKP
jgi:hypothetical protein